MHKSFHSSSEPAIDNFNLQLHRLSFSVLIHVLGAAPIKAPFDHCVFVPRSNKNCLPALELFLRGAYIRNYTVSCLATVISFYIPTSTCTCILICNSRFSHFHCSIHWRFPQLPVGSATNSVFIIELVRMWPGGLVESLM